MLLAMVLTFCLRFILVGSYITMYPFCSGQFCLLLEYSCSFLLFVFAEKSSFWSWDYKGMIYRRKNGWAGCVPILDLFINIGALTRNLSPPPPPNFPAYTLYLLSIVSLSCSLIHGFTRYCPRDYLVPSPCPGCTVSIQRKNALQVEDKSQHAKVTAIAKAPFSLYFKLSFWSFILK